MKRNSGIISQTEYCQVRNPYKPFEILSDEQIEDIHLASLELLETVGMRIMGEDVRKIFKSAGATVDESNQRVRLDRGMVLENVALAPTSFTLRGRDAAKKVRAGDGYMAFASVGGPPFCSDLDGGRRAGNYADFVNFLKITQQLNIIHVEGGCSTFPRRRGTWTYIARRSSTSTSHGSRRRSAGSAFATRWMVKLSLRETDVDLAADPVFLAVVNTNTPLTLDSSMGETIVEMAKASQVVCITPFTLAGAMAPASIAGALVLQNAECLAGIALAQLVNPGCPVCYGAFTSNVDMRTGSPAFGTPEYTKAAQASGQLARRYNLPWRSSNTNASCAPDVQSAYESQMSLWGAVMGKVSFLNQGAGWLEGGLVASFEKLIMDARCCR